MDTNGGYSTIGAGRVFRWAVAAAFGVMTVMLALYTVYMVRDILIRIIIAFFVAVSLDPVARWLTRHGIRRSVSVAIIFLTASLVMTAFIWSVAPPLMSQAANLVSHVPDYAQDLREQSATYREFVEKYDLGEKVAGFLGTLPEKFGGDVVGVAQRFFGAIFNFLLIIVLTIYFMADLPRIQRGIVRLAPRERRTYATLVVEVVVDKVGEYMIGNLIISLFAGVSTYICLLLVDVPFALPLAFFVAVTDLIPLVGATIGATGCVVVSAFTVNLWPQTSIVLIFFIAYQQLENYIIAPRVLKNTVDLSSIAVLLAALIGGTILGAVGALMAIPIVAAGKVLMMPIVAQPECSDKPADICEPPDICESADIPSPPQSPSSLPIQG